MNLLFRVVFAHGCRSTHHKLALDSLCHLRGPHAETWRNLFLKYNTEYLDGAKAPDTKFKDFVNHVLHVGDNFWGGAPATANKWYVETVAALARGDWPTAVYNAGVLSHYYTDPIMPFHTAQSVAENNIHRAAEWSITKSYDALRAIVETRLGYPEVAVPDRPDWLPEMVRDGARLSNPSYQTLIQHYDFAKGVKDPPAGLDDVSRELLARLVGHAIVGFARILEKAFEEAKVVPPQVSLTLQGFLAALQVPIKWVSNKLADSRERATVEAMFQELQQTGRVEKTLPEDDRAVREKHQEEVVLAASPPLSVPQPMVATVPMTPAPPTPPPAPATRPLRFYLERTSPVGDAPSIGPKTEARLQAVGIVTVADLLAADAGQIATKIDQRGTTRQTVQDWQDQATLAWQIPQIRGHDAQILVACGYRSVSAVASAQAAELLRQATAFVGTSEGRRLLRDAAPPDLDEVRDWINWASQGRVAKAA